MIVKKNPERQAAPLIKKAWSLTQGIAELYTVTGCYKSKEHFFFESDVTNRMHTIAKPFFFLSALDDPFFGANVIPLDHCHD
jgi:predicted alpha/beta-fold hydrolase